MKSKHIRHTMNTLNVCVEISCYKMNFNRSEQSSGCWCWWWWWFLQYSSIDMSAIRWIIILMGGFWEFSDSFLLLFSKLKIKLFIIGCGMTTSAHDLLNSQINMKSNWTGRGEMSGKNMTNRHIRQTPVWECVCACVCVRIDCYFGILNGTFAEFFFVEFSSPSIYLNNTFGVSNLRKIEDILLFCGILQLCLLLLFLAVISVKLAIILQLGKREHTKYHIELYIIGEWIQYYWIQIRWIFCIGMCNARSSQIWVWVYVSM